MYCNQTDFSVVGDKNNRLHDAIVKVFEGSSGKGTLAASFFKDEEFLKYLKTIIGDKIPAEANKNDIKRAIRNWMYWNYPAVDLTAAKIEGDTLQGFSSYKAKSIALSYTAHAIYEYDAKNKTVRASQQIVLNSVANRLKREFIENVARPAYQTYLDEGGEHIKEIEDIEKEKKACVDFLEEVRKRFGTSDKIPVNLRGETKRRNDRNKELDVSQRIAYINFLTNNGNIRERNFANMINLVFSDYKNWLEQALSLKNALSLAKKYGYTITGEDLSYFMEDDEVIFEEDKEGLNEESRRFLYYSADRYKSFMQLIDNDIKEYISNIPNLSKVWDGKGDLPVNNDNEIGLPTYMNAGFAINCILSRCNFAGGIEGLITSIEQLITNKPELYGLSVLTNEMRKDAAFARNVFHSLGHVIVSKTMIELGDYTTFKQKNTASSAKYQLLFSMVNQSKSTIPLNYDINTRTIMSKKGRNAEKDKEKYGSIKNKEELRRLIIANINKYFPGIDINAVTSYIDVSEDNLLNFLLYVNKLNIAAENLITQINNKKYSDINYDKIISAASDIVDLILPYTIVNTELNSINAEGNQSSDVMDNDYLSNLLKQIQFGTEEDANAGLNNLLSFVKQARQYDNSPIFYGVYDENGKEIIPGLFKRDAQGDVTINEKAKNIIAYSLFNGISDTITGAGFLYDKMSKGDYFVSSLIAFNRPIIDNNGKDLGFKRTGYFMRIPSDAPKNFVIQAPTIRISGLLNNDTIDRKHGLFIAYKQVLKGEIDNFIHNLNNVFEYKDNTWVIKKNTKGLFSNYHYKDTIFENGKLTGQVFKFLRLHSTDTIDVNALIEDILSLYGGANNALISKDGVLNIDRTDLIKVDETGRIVPANTFTFNEQIDNFLDNYLKELVSYAKSQSSIYSDIVGDKYSENSIIEMVLNTNLMYSSFDDLFEGDSKFYKNPQTFLKRAKEIQAGGNAYDNWSAIDPLGQNISTVTQFGKPVTYEVAGRTINARNGFRAITINNTIRPSDEAKAIKARLIELGVNKDTIDDIVSRFAGDTTTNDAQSYITIDELANRLFAKGKFKEYKPLLDKFLAKDENGKPKPVSKEDLIELAKLVEKIQVQKNIYFDRQFDVNTGVVYPRQIKNAECVLIPQLLDENSSLRKLYDIMVEKDIGQVNTAETDKAAKRYVLTFWDNNGNVTDDNYKEFIEELNNGAAIENYYYRYLYEQQQVVQHMEDEVNKAGIQILKKIIDNAKNYSPNVQDAVKSFFDNYCDNIEDSFNTFLDNMGWKVNDDGRIVNKNGGELLNYSEFYKRGKEEAKRLGMDSQFLAYFDVDDNGRAILPNFMNNTQRKFESIAQAMFNSAITRQKLPGWHAAQVTNIGNSEKLKYHKETTLTSDPNSAKAITSEIRLTPWFKSNVFIKTIEEEYDETVEDTIKEWEDVEYIKEQVINGRNVKVKSKRKELVEKKVTKTVKRKRTKRVRMSNEEILTELKELGLDKMIMYRIPTEGKQSISVGEVTELLDRTQGSTIVVPDEWVTQTGSDFDIDTVYGIQYTFKRNKETGKLEKVTEGRDGRNNAILDAMITIMSDPSVMEENLSCSNFDEIQQNIEFYNSINPEINKANESCYNIFTQMNFMENSTSGMALKALSVSRDNFSSVNSYVKSNLTEGNEITVEYNLKDYDLDTIKAAYDNVDTTTKAGYAIVKHNRLANSKNNHNVKGRLITVYSSQTTAHILDAIKTGAIFNENFYTFGCFKTLIDLGIDYKTAIGFLQQPAVTMIVNNYNRNNSIYSDSLSYSNKPIHDAVREIAQIIGIKVGGKEINEYTPIKTIQSLLERNKNVQDAYRRLFGAELSFNPKLPKNYISLNADTLISRLKRGRITHNSLLSDANKAYEDIAYDLGMILFFDNLKRITNGIEKTVRVCNPDKFGALQSVSKTREKIDTIKDIVSGKDRLASGLLEVEGITFLQAIYPGIMADDINVKDSAYPYLAAFLKYSTIPSVRVNSELFDLENETIKKYIGELEHYIGRTLTEEQKVEFKEYIVTNIYNRVPILIRPVKINSKGQVIFDTELEKLQDEERKKNNIAEYWNFERNRIFGYRVKESYNFEVKDLFSPSKEELEKYRLLTPAQKVNFIKAKFTSDAGIFKYLITNEYKGETTIKFLESTDDRESLYKMMDEAFFNTNPFIKLAAIDLIKYAFIAENGKYKRGAINKLITKRILLANSSNFGLNLVDGINSAYDEIVIQNPQELDTIARRFIASHSSITNNITLNRNNPLNKYKNGYGTFVIPVSDEDTLSTIHQYTRITDVVENEFGHKTKRIRLYVARPIINGGVVDNINENTKLESWFLYPINTLDSNEITEYSSNPNNITTKSELWYKLFAVTPKTKFDEEIKNNPKYSVQRNIKNEPQISETFIEDARKDSNAVKANQANHIISDIEVIVNSPVKGTYHGMFLSNAYWFEKAIPIGKSIRQTVTINGQTKHIIIARVNNKRLFRALKATDPKAPNVYYSLTNNEQFILDREINRGITNPKALSLYGVTVLDNENVTEAVEKYDEGSVLSQFASSKSIIESDSNYTDEMLKIKSDTIADGTFMKAPNGNPTKLNERQWLQVRTKNFINWFGDWKKVAKTTSRIKLGQELTPLSKYGQQGETDVVRYEVINENNEIIGTVQLEFRKNRKTVVLHPNIESGKGYGQELYQYIANYFNTIVEESFGLILKSDAAKHMWNSMLKKGIAKYAEIDDDIYGRQIHPNNSNVSKVVDENGEPLVVYHGTSSAPFNIFDVNRVGQQNSFAELNQGIFFTDNKDNAKSIAIKMDKGDFIINGEPLFKSDYPFMNPKYITEKIGYKVTNNSEELKQGIPDVYSKKVIEDYYKSIGKSVFVEELSSSFDNVYEVFLNIKKLDIKDYNNQNLINTSSKEFANIINNSEEGGVLQNIKDGKFKLANTYFVINPNQIKSATSNNGNFSTIDNNIYASSKSFIDANDNIKQTEPIHDITTAILKDITRFERTTRIENLTDKGLTRITDFSEKLLVDLRKAGIDTNSMSSIDGNIEKILLMAAKYYTTIGTTLLNRANKFILVDGREFSIDDKNLYLNLTEDDVDLLTELMLDIKTFGDNISAILTFQPNSDNLNIKNSIEQIQNIINKVRNNTKGAKAFEHMFDVYYANKSGNPIIRQGLIKLRQAFGDINKTDLYFSAATELNNSQIQTVIKHVNNRLKKVEIFDIPKARESFKRRYKAIMDKPGEFNMDKIVTKDGYLVRDWTDEFFAKRKELYENVKNATPNTLEWHRAKLELEKFLAKNVHRQIKQSYYNTVNALTETVLNEAGDLYTKYMELNERLQNINANNEVDTDDKIALRKALLNEMSQLASIYDEQLNEKEGEELAKAKALSKFLKAKQELNRKVFVRTASKEFNDQLEYHTRIIEEYDAKYPDRPLAVKLGDEKYANSYNWIQTNTIKQLNKTTRDKLNEAFAELKRDVEEQPNYVKHILQGKDVYDENGNIDPTKISIEDARKIKEYKESQFEENEFEPLIKNVPKNRPLFTKEYWDKFKAKSNDSDPFITELTKEINTILRKVCNSGDEITCENLLKLSDKDLQNLARLYFTLQYGYNTENSNKALSLFIKQTSESVTNDEAFNAELNYFLTNLKGTSKEKLISRIIFKRDKNGSIIIDDEGKYVANPLIFNYRMPKDEWRDVKKERAKALINDNVQWETTEEYEKAGDLAYVTGTYDEWYEANHYYNPYLGEMVPLPYWTKMKINPNGTLDATYEQVPTFNNTESSINDDYINDSYNPESSINYNKDTGDYNNTTNLSNKELEMRDLFQEILNSSATNTAMKRAAERGFMPRQARTIVNAKYIGTQIAGAVGITFGTRQPDWAYDIDYASEEDPKVPMMQRLKAKGYQQLPNKEDYIGREEEYQAKVKEIKEANAKLDAELMDRNWESVMDIFIQRSMLYNEKRKLGNQIQMLIEDLKSNKATVINWRGNPSVKNKLNDTSVEYNEEAYDNAIEFLKTYYHKLFRDEFKTRHKLNYPATLMQNITSAKYMIFNVTGGIANVLTGGVNVLGEILAKEYISKGSIRKATSEYYSNTLNMVSNQFKPTATSLTDGIIKLGNVYDIDAVLERSGNPGISEYAKRIRDKGYCMQSTGDHIMYNTVFLAMLHEHRIYRDSSTGKMTYGSEQQYILQKEIEIFTSIIQNNSNMLQLFNNYKINIKQDEKLQFEYGTFKADLVINFIKANCTKAQQKEFIKKRNEAVKQAKLEFKTKPTVYEQFELKDGYAKIKANSDFTEDMFVDIVNKTISVNHRIHGVYDKIGAAYIERYWWGSLLMQYHKHLYPMIKKLYRRRGYYNEVRGTIEKGAYQSLLKLTTQGFKDAYYSNKSMDNIVKRSIVSTVQGIYNTFNDLAFNYQSMPDWERANVRRALASHIGVLAAVLIVIGLHASFDDDDFKENNFLATCLYQADRLATESFELNPVGLPSAFRTTWSSPVASITGPQDVYKAIELISGALFDDEFNWDYTTGRYKGQNKLATLVSKQIPIYRVYDRLSHMGQSNKFYRIGNSVLTFVPTKKIGNMIQGEE